MKGSPVQLDESVIIVCMGKGYELRYWNRVMGDTPLGPRLTRKDPYPSFPTKTETRMEAEEYQRRWEQWLHQRPQPKRKRR